MNYFRLQINFSNFFPVSLYSPLPQYFQFWNKNQNEHLWKPVQVHRFLIPYFSDNFLIQCSSSNFFSCLTCCKQIIPSNLLIFFKFFLKSSFYMLWFLVWGFWCLLYGRAFLLQSLLSEQHNYLIFLQINWWECYCRPPWGSRGPCLAQV